MNKILIMNIMNISHFCTLLPREACHLSWETWAMAKGKFQRMRERKTKSQKYLDVLHFKFNLKGQRKHLRVLANSMCVTS